MTNELLALLAHGFALMSPDSQQRTLDAARCAYTDDAWTEISAAYEAEGFEADSHSYWNTDEDYYIDLYPRGMTPRLAERLKAIEAKYQSPLARVHLSY